MERLITHHVIQTYLTRLNELLVIANSAGESTLATVCEGLMLEMFNIIYDTKFENTNLKISNFPAIDLHDQDKRIAIQITSNDTLSKIYTCYDKFLKYNLQASYDRLIIVVLSTTDLNKKTLKNNCEKIQTKYKAQFNLDFDNDIINLTSLYKLITIGSEIEKINDIRALLEKSFEKIKQIGELDSYHKHLKSMFFDVVMDDETGLTLNSIYIEPSFDILIESANKLSSDLKYLNATCLQLNKDFSIHKVLMSRLKGENTYNQLFEYPNSNVTFILGYPGQGKTSLCSKLLFDLLTIPQQKPVFYLKLRNISDTKAFIHNPFNLIFNELDNEIDTELKKTQLKSSITILDGLDELFMKDNLTADDIETFCKGIIHETEKYKGWQVIITTRHGYVNFQRLYKEAYVALSLKPIDIHRQKDWLSKYLVFHPESWLTSEYLEISNNDKNHSQTYLKELINQPLLLYIVASLKSRPDDKVSRAQIYNLLFDQIIERKYSKDGQIENLKGLTLQDLRRMVQEIAYMIFKSGKGFVNTKDILNNETIRECLNQIGNDSLSNTLKGVMISFYFKETRDKDKSEDNEGIEFFHKSLQEYLTAEFIVEITFDYFLRKDKLDKYINKKASDTLIFLNQYFGSLPIPFEIWNFMEELISKKASKIKLELSDRLALNINYLFEKDFIAGFNSIDSDPIALSTNTFSSYWSILQSVNQGRNYFIEKSIGLKFLIYHTIIDQSTRPWACGNQFIYQHFIDQPLRAISVYESILLQTKFEDCWINILQIYGCALNNVSFVKCDISHLTLDETILNDVRFIGCEIYNLEIDAGGVKKLSFEACDLESNLRIYGKLKNKIVFRNCSIDKSCLENLLKYKPNIQLQNCYTRTYHTIANSAMTHTDEAIVWDRKQTQIHQIGQDL
ncbi:hypothetical protein ASE92_06620 [Pedobacter sp. Leaf41]|uniref:SMEK domain-containing protein n=1 Tax=Pedobacter sp. Leaf41 TaxID=1736218 RepID=UPI0007036BCB|nr:SMEK domain-containing protein [Pedobacter sp. Leaf41]KQN35815.1 hypothetical protein ASE92_06620 [Pedobacter sp. Leaf41]